MNRAIGANNSTDLTYDDTMNSFENISSNAIDDGWLDHVDQMDY